MAEVEKSTSLPKEERVKTNSIREAIEALAEQWEKEVRGTHPENTRSYWEGRADALNDLRAILATHPAERREEMNFTQESYEELYGKIVKQVQIWEHKKENKTIMAHGLLADRVMKILAKELPHVE